MVNFVYLFKRPTLSFVIFSIVFIVSTNILIFIISFLLLALGLLCYSFSNPLRCKVGLFDHIIT